LKEVLSNVKATFSPGVQPHPLRVTVTDVPITAWLGSKLILAVDANAGVALTRNDSANRMTAHGVAKRHLKNKRRK